MPYYLVQAAYTAEAIAAMVKKPENRETGARAAVEKLGGKLEGFWFGFGDYDVVAVTQMPDNVSAAAGALAISQTGHLKAFKTPPLMTTQEAIEAMKKAGNVSYSAPGKS